MERTFSKIHRDEKRIILSMTMLAPGGVLCIKEKYIPITKHTTDIIAERQITAKNLLLIRIAERDGNTIRLDMSKAPIILMPKTTVIEVRSAKIIL